MTPPLHRALQLALVAAVLLGGPLAHAQRAAWLRDRLDVEWVVGTGGWRAAMGSGDVRTPGFDALAGGGEFVLGLDIGVGLAIVGDGRVMAGRAGSSGQTYFEALGSLALQLRLGRVRLRAGPAAGQAIWRGDRATLVGAFIGGSIDLFPLGNGRLSTTILVRLDLDADLGAMTYLPDSSVALAIGIGVRY
ncbi:MAG: hypothetical protein JWN44_4362 [Myxococcales bacterium]|nr:hypothetical protein [Myxococcales bacterium]